MRASNLAFRLRCPRYLLHEDDNEADKGERLNEGGSQDEDREQTTLDLRLTCHRGGCTISGKTDADARANDTESISNDVHSSSFAIRPTSRASYTEPMQERTTPAGCRTSVTPLLVLLDELDVDGGEQREDIGLNDSDQNLHEIDDEQKEDPEHGYAGITNGRNGHALQERFEEE